MTMKKVLLLALVCFAVIGGAVIVMTVHPQSALADGCTGSGC
jgi:hypothetical protein